jgi:hypothetical protein
MGCQIISPCQSSTYNQTSPKLGNSYGTTEAEKAPAARLGRFFILEVRMPSAEKLAANRNNARRSSGAWSEAG